MSGLRDATCDGAITPTRIAIMPAACLWMNTLRNTAGIANPCAEATPITTINNWQAGCADSRGFARLFEYGGQAGSRSMARLMTGEKSSPSIGILLGIPSTATIQAMVI